MNILFSNTDINTNIFSWLSSYERAFICSVCKLFAVEVLRVSMLLVSHGPLLKLYEYTRGEIPCDKSFIGGPLTKQIGVDIAADAHLVMRLKVTWNHVIYGIGIAGDARLVELYKSVLTKGCDKYDLLTYGLAYNGHTDILRDIVSQGYTVFSYSIYQAAKGGHVDTIKYLSNVSEECPINIIYGGCKINNPDIINLVPEPWPSHYYCGAFIGAVKGGHLELAKKMYNEAPNEISRHNIKEAMKGAQKRGYTDVCEYLSLT